MTMMKAMTIVLGGVLFATALYTVVALPGLLTDTASTMPVSHLVAGSQP